MDDELMPIQAGGTQQYWFNGESFEGAQKGTSPPDPGKQKYWLNGQTAAAIMTGSPPFPTGHDDWFMFTIAPI
jgi:hypothetical protein